MKPSFCKQAISLPGISFFLAIFLSPLSFHGQQKAPVNPAIAPVPAPLKETDPTKGKASFVTHAWSKNGELVLAIKISPGSIPLQLGGIKGRSGANGTGESLNAFSMGSSILIDLTTGAEIKPLPRLPRKPFFGTMSGILLLAPGNTQTFGVAFPHPPTPPKDPNGKIPDYNFKLIVPDMEPATFTIPFEPAPAPVADSPKTPAK